MLNQAGEGLRAEPANWLAMSGGELADEEVGKQRNIFATFPQRRHPEANGCKAVGELGPQRANRSEPAQRAGGEAENLAGDGVGRAEKVLVVNPLKQIKQGSLICGSEFVNASEDKRAAARTLQRGEHGEFGTRRGARRSERRSGEELGGRAGNEGRRGARAKVMQRAGGEHFSGAGLSLDGRDAKMARGVTHLRNHALHDGTATDHLAEGPAGQRVCVHGGVLVGRFLE